jgi:uncharacterized circularly permuted ATP-grasp superfamily protein
MPKSSSTIIQDYKATFIGLLFTVIGIFSYYTFIIPLLIMMPIIIPLELLLEEVFPKSNYSTIGQGIVATLIILLIFISTIFMRKFIQQINFLKIFKVSSIISYMIFLQFIVHPLVFYIHLSGDWSRASDGQFFMAVDETFQLSSLMFLLIGIFLDYIKFSKLKYAQKNFENKNIA